MITFYHPLGSQTQSCRSSTSFIACVEQSFNLMRRFIFFRGVRQNALDFGKQTTLFWLELRWVSF